MSSSSSARGSKGYPNGTSAIPSSQPSGGGHGWKFGRMSSGLAKLAAASRATAFPRPWRRNQDKLGFKGIESVNPDVHDTTPTILEEPEPQPEFQDGNPGKMIDDADNQDGHIWRGHQYVGQWQTAGQDGQGRHQDGRPQGYGRCEFRNGDEYQGQWMNGQEHGDGVEKVIRGNVKSTYRGQFFQGVRSGHGHQQWDSENGAWHEGAYVNGCMTGPGEMLLSNGARYDGQFHRDTFDGEGFMDYGNGSWYRGEWCHDQRAGSGTYHLPDGSEYIGRFQDDMPHGLGSLSKADGERYTGQWIDGREHGNGKMINADGTVKFGLWSYGRSMQWFHEHKLLQL